MRTVLILLISLVAFSVSNDALSQSNSVTPKKQYSYGDGSLAFELNHDFLAAQPFDATLRMNGNEEIWVLKKSQGARGTVLYRNDTGRVFLRVNHVGGATFYPTPDSMGVPVLRMSENEIGIQTLAVAEQEGELSSIEDWGRAYEYAGNRKAVESNLNEPIDRSDFIEFSEWPRAKSKFKSELIAHISEVVRGHSVGNIDRVIVKIGDQPDAIRANNSLTIWVNPSLGIAGKPSTEKIRAHLRGNDG